MNFSLLVWTNIFIWFFWSDPNRPNFRPASQLIFISGIEKWLNGLEELRFNGSLRP